MTDSSAIMTDAQTDEGHDDDSDDASVEAFLKNLNAEKPSKGDEETTETEEEAPSEETEETEDEEGEKKDDKTSVELSDETTVKVKVNGEEVEVPLGDLKRLAGQERALNAKSMEVAETRKVYETTTQKAEAVIAKALELAKARLAPYEEMDWIAVNGKVDEGTWRELRSAALSAKAELDGLTAVATDHAKSAQEIAQKDMRAAAKAALEVLQGPVSQGGIEGWSQPLYNDLMTYAVSQGIPQATAYSVVDPSALRVMHKAMLFDKGKTAASEQITKVKAQATKVAKPSSNGASSGSSSKSNEALARLAKTGSDDDAVAAFLASFK